MDNGKYSKEESYAHSSSQIYREIGGEQGKTGDSGIVKFPDKG